MFNDTFIITDEHGNRFIVTATGNLKDRDDAVDSLVAALMQEQMNQEALDALDYAETYEG